MNAGLWLITVSTYLTVLGGICLVVHLHESANSIREEYEPDEPQQLPSTEMVEENTEWVFEGKEWIGRNPEFEGGDTRQNHSETNVQTLSSSQIEPSDNLRLGPKESTEEANKESLIKR